MVKLSPYKDLIVRAKEAVESAMAPIRAMQMRKKGEIEILKLDEQLVAQENKIHELAGKHPINYDAILNAIDEMELLQRRRRKFREVVKQLFPEARMDDDLDVEAPRPAATGEARPGHPDA